MIFKIKYVNYINGDMGYLEQNFKNYKDAEEMLQFLERTGRECDFEICVKEDKRGEQYV